MKKITGMAAGILLLLSLIVPGYAFKENIVAAWTMDEGSGKTVHDVANGNDGEIKGGAKWVDGKFGKALNFDGSSGYVEIPFNESLRVINQGDFTLAAWFMPNAVPTENKEVFQQGDKNGTGRTWLFIAANVGEIRSWLGGAGTYSGVNVKAGEWYHAAVVVTEGGNTDTVQIYVNGKQSGNPLQKAMEDSEGNYFIGCHKNLTNFWDGIIDDVVLFNKALNEDEIKELMTNGVMNVLAVQPKGKLALRWGDIKR